MTLQRYKHQREGTQFILSSHNTLLWHEVGLGKTLTATDSARVLLARIRNHVDPMIRSANPKALVVAPTGLNPQWRAEIQKLAPDMALQMLFMPYSQLHKAKGLLSYYDIRVLIFDESHYIKTMGTRRINRVIALLDTLGKSVHGFADGKIIQLTGTPMPNSAAEIYTSWAMLAAPTIQEAVIRLADNKRYMKWVAAFTERDAKAWFSKDKKGVAKQQKGWGAPKGVTNEELMNQLIGPFVHFRTADECLDLPRVNEVNIDLGIQDDMLLADADIKKPIEYMAIVERLARAKVPHALKWVEDFLVNNPTKKLIVFCPYRWALLEIYKKYEVMSCLVMGGMSIPDQQKSVDAWTRGERRLILGTYGAMSTGRNLQSGHHTLYISYPWSPKIVRQAQGRTRRSGQTEVTHHFFLMSGQNDKKVLRNLLEKEAGITAVEDLLSMGRSNIAMPLTIGGMV